MIRHKNHSSNAFNYHLKTIVKYIIGKLDGFNNDGLAINIYENCSLCFYSFFHEE